jgi:hypothetical protein
VNSGPGSSLSLGVRRSAYAAALLVLSFASCSAEPNEGVRVRVVDAAGTVLPSASVWVLPIEAMDNLRWIPSELWSWQGNQHELLRRLGAPGTADGEGFVRVPAGSLLAGQCGDLAGIVRIPAAAAAAPASLPDLVLDDAAWTIVVRDQEGQPVVGVPVACEAAGSRIEQFEGTPIGCTDGDGRLVVRAPHTAPVARRVPFEGPDPGPPTHADFEVDVMYLAPHAGTLPCGPGTKGAVTLTLPPVTRVELRLPQWKGPIVPDVWLTRTGKGMTWDNATSFPRGERPFVLVGVAPGGRPTSIVAQLVGTTIRKQVDVPPAAPGVDFVLDLSIPDGDFVVRARVRDARGRPAQHACLRVTVEPPASSHVRSSQVYADEDGRIALVVGADLPPDATVSLHVHASRDPERIGERAELRLPALRAHVDLGDLVLRPRAR